MNENNTNQLCPSQLKEPRSECPIASGLEVLGDRWTMLIIRDMMLTNRNEFGHFLKSAEGISTNILTERLERLQCHGLIKKLPHPSHGKKFIYELTESGKALAPVLCELAIWSAGMFPETVVPEELKQRFVKDKNGVIEQIKRGEPFFILDL